MPLEATLDEIPPDECLELLARHSVGRLAVASTGEAPHVVPVTYRLDGEVVVFRTDPGTKLAALRVGPVSFQVDEIDPLRRVGWSVLVQGIAYEATAVEVADVDLEPWAPGDRATWVRIVPTRVTGRRIELAQAPTDPRGYM